MRSVEIKNFSHGLITSLEAESIFPDAASDSKNWLTSGDHLELSDGYKSLGTLVAGTGKVTGLFIAHKADGTEVPFKTLGKKVYYMDTGGTWNEVGSDLLGTAADGEDVSFAEYFSPAGAQLWISSPNSGLWKIMTANPTSPVDQYASNLNYKGLISIKQNRMFLWDRKDDKSGVYCSYVDDQNYQEVDNENVGTGNGSNKHFTDTLTFNVSYLMATCFGVEIRSTTSRTVTDGVTVLNSEHITSATANFTSADIGAAISGTNIPSNSTISSIVSSTEVIISAKSTSDGSGISITILDYLEKFTDDFNGNLSSSDGGTGTINYATGAFDITFHTAPLTSSAVVAIYQWENSQDKGIADFTYSATRLAGEGNVYRQGDGGSEIKNIFSYNNVEFVMHRDKTWQLTIGNDDTNATNLIYRDRVGISNWRAGCATGDGIYYIDDIDHDNPAFRLLTLNGNLTQVIPTEISDMLDLSGYLFDKGVVSEFGVYVLFAGRTLDSSQNNVVFIYNKQWKCWDVRYYRISCLAIYDGQLVSGDSITNNVNILFDGQFDNETSLISNYWIGANSDLGITELKKIRSLRFDGLISLSQNIDIYAAVDGGNFGLIGSISGTGSYVDSSIITIGSMKIGSTRIGGESDSSVTASNYRREITVAMGRFERIKLRFIATGYGYCSVSKIEIFDIKLMGQKISQKYR